jgi:chromosome segregation ATPase
MVRKIMNLEMTIDNLKSAIKTKENEITNAQETLMHQNEIQLQITESIKTLTNERDALREEKDSYIKASKERDRLKAERDETLNKVESLQREITRVNSEMQMVWDENQALKNLVPKSKLKRFEDGGRF